MSVDAALWTALAIAVALAALHLLAPRIASLPGVPERATGSFAGGIAAAYVFLHMLPELAEGNQAIGEALQNEVPTTPLVDLAVFAIALVGFVFFYGLERRAADQSGDSHEPSVLMFRTHLASFAMKNALIVYTMPLRLRTGVAFALLFSVAIGLHFVLTDRGLRRNYPRRFRSQGRYVLAGALLLGWVAAALAAPTSAVAVAAMNGFLGGAILLNVFKEEIPEGRGSSFRWFVIGAVLYGALLALVTHLSE